MSRINIPIPLGTLSAFVPFIGNPTENNTKTPLTIGSIPSGSKYMDICIKYNASVWANITRAKMYPHLEVVDKICIWIDDVNSYCDGIIQCWGKVSGTWQSVKASSITFRVTNGILSVSPCHPTVNGDSRYMTDGIYRTGNPMNGANISATFYGF